MDSYLRSKPSQGLGAMGAVCLGQDAERRGDQRLGGFVDGLVKKKSWPRRFQGDAELG